MRTLVKRAEAAESWMGDKRLFPITIDRIAPYLDFLSQRVTGCVLSSVYNNLSSLCRRIRVEPLPQRDPLLQTLLSSILDRQGAEVQRAPRSHSRSHSRLLPQWMWPFALMLGHPLLFLSGSGLSCFSCVEACFSMIFFTAARA